LKDDKQSEQNGALQTAQSVNYFVNQFTLHEPGYAGGEVRRSVKSAKVEGVR
jgi:hypothetical protein